MATKFRKLFKKRIIKPGPYSVPDLDAEGKVQHDPKTGEIITKEVEVPESRIDHWVQTHKKMVDAGLSIPAPFRHDPKAVPIRLAADKDDTDAFKNGGFWRKLWKDKTGAAWGQIEVRSKEAAEAIKNIEDVSLVAKGSWIDGNGQKYEDALTHIALVTHPVAKDTDGFEEVENESPALDIAASFSFQDTLALSMSAFSYEDGTGEQVNSGMAEINASSLSVKDVIEMLKTLDPPIRLPDDTTSENFLERMGTALAAIEGIKSATDAGGESIREPNKNSKEQPGPVAMSKELTFALGLLSSANVVNPATQRPYTEAELKALSDKQTAPVVNLKMSAEDQAAVNLARRTLTTTYQGRVEALVKNGQVTPQYAKEELAPFLKDIQFAFDDQGKQVDTAFDKLLKACEKIPKGSVLTGHSPTSARAQRNSIFGQDAFSLGGIVNEEELPGEMTGEDEIGVVSMEDADELVDAQLRMAGYTGSRVEGGFRQKAGAR